MQMEGLHVRVDKASERRASKKDDAGVFYHPGRTLFVGNLPFDATVSHFIHWHQIHLHSVDLLRSFRKSVI